MSTFSQYHNLLSDGFIEKFEFANQLGQNRANILTSQLFTWNIHCKLETEINAVSTILTFRYFVGALDQTLCVMIHIIEKVEQNIICWKDYKGCCSVWAWPSVSTFAIRREGKTNCLGIACEFLRYSIRSNQAVETEIEFMLQTKYKLQSALKQFWKQY